MLGLESFIRDEPRAVVSKGECCLEIKQGKQARDQQSAIQTFEGVNNVRDPDGDNGNRSVTTGKMFLQRWDTITEGVGIEYGQQPSRTKASRPL